MIYSILEGKQAEEYKARKDSDKSKKNIASKLPPHNILVKFFY